ncbi:MAG: membrane protein insertion efficiency factor YidD [Patescibacteria group bacterium]|nr:membrane protein insertion efficiency factor YidD [Patescibacteria group bacterium]
MAGKKKSKIKLNTLIKIPRYFASGFIRVYQFFLSTDHSFWAKPEVFRICTYHPSCSEFTRQSILKHGVILGSFMGLKRIVDCNPFSKGGYDPVPEKFSLKRYQGNGVGPRSTKS